MTTHSAEPRADPIAGEALLTIVISLRNNRAGLRRSLDSIIGSGAAVARVRVLIIDGNSHDAPVEVVEAFADALDIEFHSSFDTGIYNAWNKAVALTRTPWLTFFGSGDAFAPDALALLVARLDREADFDILTGRVRLIYPSGRREVRGLPYDAQQFARWFSLAHSGAVYRHALFRRFGNFDERYRVTGDYEFLTRVARNARFAFVDHVLSDFPVDGISSASLLPLKESYRVRKAYKSVGRIENALLLTRAILLYHAARWLK